MTLNTITHYGSKLWQCAKQAPHYCFQKTPAVYFDIRTDVFMRYADLLVEFFCLCDWRVFVRRRDGWLKSTDPYSTLWLDEPNIRLTSTRPFWRMLSFHEGVEGASGSIPLSPDYFTESPSPHSFRIPMTMHPLLYHSGLWNAPLDACNLRSGVFFAGNFDESEYCNSLLNNLFGCPSRVQMLDGVRQNLSGLCQYPRTEKELEQCQGGNHIIYVDRKYFSVPQEKIRCVLSKFAFFLAHPGVVMPLCHNVVEALSAGCIPILHEGYARALHPGLSRGHNCVTFTDLPDLYVKLRDVLTWKHQKIAEMHKNVNVLYEEAFTPVGVVRVLHERRNELKYLYLQAEQYSVERFRLERERSRNI